MDATGGAALTPPMSSRPIRVLHVMEATIGGTKRHLLDLAAAADRGDFQIEVACPRVRSEPRGDTSFFDDISTLDIAVHVTPMVRAIRPIKDLRSTWELLRLIHRGRFDIVHTHSTKAGVVGRVAAMIRPGVRTVHTPHGFYFLNFPSPIVRAPLRWLEWVLGRVTSVLIALSESERRVAVGIVPARKLRVVPLTFAPFEPVPRAEARRRLGLPPMARSLAQLRALPSRRRRSTSPGRSPRSIASAPILASCGPTTANSARRWKSACKHWASARRPRFLDT